MLLLAQVRLIDKYDRLYNHSSTGNATDFGDLTNHGTVAAQVMAKAVLILV